MQLNIQHLDLTQIAESGQCFRWRRLDDDAHVTYIIPSFGPEGHSFDPLVISDMGAGDFRLSCSKADYDRYWSDYLDMSTDYDEVGRRILDSGDEHSIDSYRLGEGIRILRQDTWEMIITFLISQNNNIKRITASVGRLCERHFGGRSEDTDAVMASVPFPRPEEFDTELLSDRTLGLGYRASYIYDVVRSFRDNPKIPEELGQMSYEDAYDTLLRFAGIGPKVANCICLFGLHHIEAFPIDTHVKQLLEKYYKNGFPYEYYEGIAGIVQQYLFYYELKNK